MKIKGQWITNKIEIKDGAQVNDVLKSNGANQPNYWGTGGSGSGGISVPAGTETGQILYWNGSEWTLLATGGNEQILQLESGIPSWNTFTSMMLSQHRGDLMFGNSTTGWDILDSTGQQNKFLMSNGIATDPSWETIAILPLPSSAGHVLWFDGINWVTLSPDGHNGDFLQCQGNTTPIWTTVSSAGFTNAEPTVNTVGGIIAGSTFNNQTSSEMWNALLYATNITNFTFTGWKTIYEVGELTPIDPIATWTINNEFNVMPNTLNIEDVSGGSTFVDIIDIDHSTHSHNCSMPTAITKDASVMTTPTVSHQFRLSIENSLNQTLTRNLTFEWRWITYYGETVSPSLIESEIITLRSHDELENNRQRTYSFVETSPTPTYKYICYPITFSEASGFTDTSNNLPVPFEIVYTVNVTNSRSQAIDYYVYRSTQQMAGTINIRVS